MNKGIFEFSDYSFDSGNRTAIFRYKVSLEDGREYEFEEVLTFKDKEFVHTSQTVLERALHAVHLALGVSYYKLFLPSEIILKTKTLTKSQANFWNTTYTKGLGQLFYENKIDFRGLINFPCNDGVSEELDVEKSTQGEHTVLVAFGGGKDSLLSNYLLKKNSSLKLTAYSFKRNKTLEYLAEKNNLDYLVVDRKIDAHLIELNKQGVGYDGHVPITTMNSFVAVLTSVLYGFSEIVFSNEVSSNFGNVSYLGEEINHQWSKSAEFESLLQKYIQEFIIPLNTYFSLLRPFHEIEIVKRFVECNLDQNMMTSCNRNFTLKDNADVPKLWCGECAKCIFTFAMFSAFISREKIVEMFGVNLHEQDALIPLFKDILGTGTMKPFDCVGTPDEMIVAMCRAYKNNEYSDDVVMKMFEKEVLPTISSMEDLEKKVFAYGDDSLIPEQFKKLLS